MQQSEMAWRKCLLLAKFKAAVCMFLFGFLIALCMPDGYNRTGYVICCYLVEQLGLTAEQALAEVIVCVCVCLCVSVCMVSISHHLHHQTPFPAVFFPHPTLSPSLPVCTSLLHGDHQASNTRTFVMPSWQSIATLEGATQRARALLLAMMRDVVRAPIELCVVQFRKCIPELMIKGSIKSS